MSPPLKKGEPYFHYMGIIILALVVFGFLSHAIFNPQKLPGVSFGLIMHGVFMMAWYVLFVLQTSYIRSEKPLIHMRMGQLSLIVAVGILISGPMVTVSSFLRSADPMIVIANIVNLTSFVFYYSIAFWKRKNSTWHKRLMLFASLSMIVPALFRIFDTLGIDPNASAMFWFLLILSVVVYDVMKLKRVHLSTMIGVVITIIGTAIILNIGSSDSWLEFLNSFISK
jgi:hypothetical protein